jgi:hypothetical protein
VSLAGVSFCFACGGSLTSNAETAMPPVPPPAQFAPPQSPGPAVAQLGYGAAGPFGAPPARYNVGAPSGVIAARPTGTAILTIVEIAVAVAGVLVAIDLLRWADWRFTYDDFAWGLLDLAMGGAYVAASATGFGVARGIWSLQPWAWTRACTLSLGLLGLLVVSVFVWGVEGQDILGLLAHASILAYLSLSSVRVLFGRSATTLFEGPR